MNNCPRSTHQANAGLQKTEELEGDFSPDMKYEKGTLDDLRPYLYGFKVGKSTRFFYLVALYALTYMFAASVYVLHHDYPYVAIGLIALVATWAIERTS